MPMEQWKAYKVRKAQVRVVTLTFKTFLCVFLPVRVRKIVWTRRRCETLRNIRGELEENQQAQQKISTR